MKSKEFIEKHKIKPVLAAGFLEHLKTAPEANLEEEFLLKSFQEFSGKNLAESKITNPDEKKEEEQSNSNAIKENKSNKGDKK